MAGMRAVAVVCLMWAAWPAAGQEPGGGLAEGLDEMARELVSLFNRAADREGERPEVSFRPAWTGPQGVRVYCEALTRGLRNALHRRTEVESRHRGNPRFTVRVADDRRVEPPDVTVEWQWDEEAGSVRVEAHVLLPYGGSERVEAALDAAGLSGPQRACLFSFRPGGGMVTAKGAGVLSSDLTFGEDAIEHMFRPGEEFFVRGELRSAVEGGTVWSVVLWTDEEGNRRNLFTTDLPAPAGHRFVVLDMRNLGKSHDLLVSNLKLALRDTPPLVRSQFDIYVKGNELWYAKDPCIPSDIKERFFLHLIPIDVNDLPEHRKVHRFDNLDFSFSSNGMIISGICIAIRSLPDYPFSQINTGQYISGEGRIWSEERPVPQYSRRSN